MRCATRTHWQGLVLGGLLMLAAGVECAPDSAPAQGAKVGSPAPEIRLPSVETGQPVRTLSEHRGKVVLLNFWATWCIPCREEMPDLQALADDLRGERFAVLTVDLQEDADQVLRFQREIGVNLPALIDGDGSTVRAYGVRALPATFLVDAKGVLREQRLGALARENDGRPWSRGWIAQQVRAYLAG